MYVTWPLQIPLPRSELPKTFSATRVSLREKQKETDRGKPRGDNSGESEGTTQDNVPPIISVIGAGTGQRIDGASTTYFIGTEVSRKQCYVRRIDTDQSMSYEWKNVFSDKLCSHHSL